MRERNEWSHQVDHMQLIVDRKFHARYRPYLHCGLTAIVKLFLFVRRVPLIWFAISFRYNEKLVTNCKKKKKIVVQSIICTFVCLIVLKPFMYKVLILSTLRLYRLYRFADL